MTTEGLFCNNFIYKQRNLDVVYMLHFSHTCKPDTSNRCTQGLSKTRTAIHARAVSSLTSSPYDINLTSDSGILRMSVTSSRKRMITAIWPLDAHNHRLHLTEIWRLSYISDLWCIMLYLLISVPPATVPEISNAYGNNNGSHGEWLRAAHGDVCQMRLGIVWFDRSLVARKYVTVAHEWQAHAWWGQETLCDRF